jgi:hypothetical protein
MFALPLVLALWPGFVTFWLLSAAHKKLGLEPGPFFKPAPAIETRQEKAERRALEAEQREAVQAERIAELEAELLGKGK